MNERVNPFLNLKDAPAFTTKPKAEKQIEEETIARIAEDNKFPSREAPKPKKPERRKLRIHRTGRNVQFNAKLTAETNDQIYRLANVMSEERGEPLALGALLKLAMDALERERAAARDKSPG